MAGHLADLYRYRALIGTLVLRELRARYRGSFLGFLWSFLNPLLLMLVYALVFSIYLRVPMEGYAVFLFSGLLPWPPMDPTEKGLSSEDLGETQAHAQATRSSVTR